jgi:ABC-type lipoprotein export system ATPase subunit
LLAIRTTNVAKSYGSPFGGGFSRAIAGVSIDILRGSFVALMGPSGAGKTTLLNLIARVDVPDSGAIEVDGLDLSALEGDDLAAFRRRSIGVVFQDSTLLETLTLRENIALPLLLDRATVCDAADRVSFVAASLGISGLLDKYPWEVSGGQRQRAGAARAIVADPAVLLADEPTGSLDSASSRDLLASFQSLNVERKTTILMATHDPFAASWAERVLFLRDGRLFTEIRSGGDRRAFFERVMKLQAAAEGRF